MLRNTLKLVLAFCTTIAACQAPRSSDPRFETALQKVWAFYGATTEAPEVEAVTGTSLDCGQGNAFLVPGPNNTQVCAAGAHYPGTRLIRIALPKPTKASATALAHELAHQLQEDQGLPDDYQHVSQAFQPGGIVGAANAMLQADGE